MIFDNHMNILSTGDITQIMGEESSDLDASQDQAEPSAHIDNTLWNINTDWSISEGWSIDEDGYWYRVE